jgi:hypothetical protein
MFLILSNKCLCLISRPHSAASTVMRGRGQGQVPGHVVGGSGNGTGTASRAGIGKGKGTGMGAGTGTGLGTGTGTEGNQRVFTAPSSSSSLEYHPDYTAPSSPTPSASCLSCARPLSQKPHFRHEDKIASLPHLVSTFEEEMSVLLARTQLDAHGGPPVDSSLTHSNSNSKFHSKSAPHLSFGIDLDERYDTRITLTRPDPRSG